MCIRDRVRSAGNGWYTITSCCSAKLLDVQNASTAAGANVQQYQNNGSNAQKWKFVMGEKGIQIVSALGNVVDVKNASGKSGANVQVWSKNSSDAQQWKIYTAARPSKMCIRDSWEQCGCFDGSRSGIQ